MNTFWDSLLGYTSGPNLEDFISDFEKAEYLQRILTNHATQDGPSNDEHYRALRKRFLDRADTQEHIPSWVRTNSDLQQFWQFIKHKFSTYRERREFIWSEFRPLLDYLEGLAISPLEEEAEGGLAALDSGYVVSIWQKALARRDTDPDGAITSARSLLEAVLKHVLDECGVEYDRSSELHELYKAVSGLLSLDCEQHEEVLYRKVLGGCSSIVSGIGELRNRVGDAHGQGRHPYRPDPRHAELAVNLAGAMCLFIVRTYSQTRDSETEPSR